MDGMEIIVLDTNFIAVGILENYESLLWTDRYNEPGDFEIYTPVTDELLDLLRKDRYLVYLKSEHVMIIETLKLQTDVEDGDYILITGRSLESILDRRIVWKQTNLRGGLQECIKKLLNENIIAPKIEARKIDNFIMEESEDFQILKHEYDAQHTGDSLLDVIVSICQTYGIGFKIILDSQNNFVFSLYKGSDRSYDQTELPYVIFSTNFNNILKSTYLDDASEYYNVTLVAGEGEGSARKTVAVGEASGINRRELFTDARDISTTVEGTDQELTSAQYNKKLKQRGEEKLAECKQTENFEGEVDYATQFILNEDYFIGDIVQVENQYGIQGVATVLEIIRSNDKEGFKISPTFGDISFNTGGKAVYRIRTLSTDSKTASIGLTINDGDEEEILYNTVNTSAKARKVDETFKLSYNYRKKQHWDIQCLVPIIYNNTLYKTGESLPRWTYKAIIDYTFVMA